MGIVKFLIIIGFIVGIVALIPSLNVYIENALSGAAPIMYLVGMVIYIVPVEIWGWIVALFGAKMIVMMIEVIL